MDRSFLSNVDVVNASREFVCIRLATYEDAQEAEFMKSIYLPRSGAMENTTFAVLSPDGKRNLTRAGRGPQHSFRRASTMASSMSRIAKEHRDSTKTHDRHSSLPLMKSVELGLNVAAADGLPMIVTTAESQEALTATNKRLVSIAWSDELLGQFVYASSVREKDLKPLTGIKSSSKILVVDPGQFGLSGRVIRQLSAETNANELQSELKKIVASYPQRTKDHNSHVRMGIQLGIDWESEIPETDAQSIRAKERARGK